MFWLQLAPDGKVRFLMPRMELGQGANVGLIQVVAEELNVPPDDIVRIAPDTENAPEFKMTVGSESIQEFFEPVSFEGICKACSCREVWCFYSQHLRCVGRLHHSRWSVRIL